MPLLFMDNFVNPTILKKSNSREVFDSEYPVSVLDICSGKTDHINLKKVVSTQHVSQTLRDTKCVSSSRDNWNPSWPSYMVN